MFPGMFPQSLDFHFHVSITMITSNHLNEHISDSPYSTLTPVETTTNQVDTGSEIGLPMSSENEIRYFESKLFRH